MIEKPSINKLQELFIHKSKKIRIVALELVVVIVVALIVIPPFSTLQLIVSLNFQCLEVLVHLGSYLQTYVTIKLENSILSIPLILVSLKSLYFSSG